MKPAPRPTSKVISVVPLREGVVLLLCEDGSLWELSHSVLGYGLTRVLG